MSLASGLIAEGEAAQLDAFSPAAMLSGTQYRAPEADLTSG